MTNANLHGNWTKVSDATAAGNTRVASADRAGPTVPTPFAAPVDYFEASFNAPAGDYRIWLRLRAAGDSKFNESVWVQLSDATNAGGSPLWRIGTDQALLVNLEDCDNCGVSGWGWQDNAWWLGESSVVKFAAARLAYNSRADARGRCLHRSDRAQPATIR